MNQKTINIIFVTVLIILLAIIAFLFVENNTLKNQNKNEEENIVNLIKEEIAKNQQEVDISNDESTTIKEPALDNQIEYLNSKYGFSLMFPETWNLYKATEKTASSEWLGNTYGVEFGLPKQDRLFAIGVYTKTQWQKISSEEGPKPTYIKENSRYVFAYSGAHDYIDEYRSLSMEITDIIKTFKLVYVNTAGDYRFQYPEEWTIDSNGTTAEINGGKFAAVAIITPALANSTEKYLDYLSDKRTIISTDKVTINGLSATKTVISQDGLYYFIEHNNKVYFIHLTDISTASDLEKFNIILNSFQFIN